jgi:hypothetical protein
MRRCFALQIIPACFNPSLELLGGFKLLSEGELGSVSRVWGQISGCIRKGMDWDESLKA